MALAVLHAVRDLLARLGNDTSLTTIAAGSGWSPFQFHRAFHRLVGETPKRYTLRLRLERAAARLATTDDSVLEVALAAGFGSHEVFTRAFRRQFGCTPTGYRHSAIRNAPADVRARHAALIETVGPCVGLYHVPITPPRSPPMPVLSIARKEIPAQPILFIRRRIGRQELQSTLAECFGKLFGHAQRLGLPVAGFPLARYVSTGPGLWTVEPAVPLATPATGDGEIEAGFLSDGPVAFAVHAGPYEQLTETHAAVESWMERNGYRANGAPWEWYVTDPGQHPDPADWRTEVYWPLAE